VTPVAGVVHDETIISREAHSYAEAFTHRTCPTGYNFYGDAALRPSKRERTFVFLCQ
jgi:hypothetical protein